MKKVYLLYVNILSLMTTSYAGDRNGDAVRVLAVLGVVAPNVASPQSAQKSGSGRAHEGSKSGKKNVSKHDAGPRRSKGAHPLNGHGQKI